MPLEPVVSVVAEQLVVCREPEDLIVAAQAREDVRLRGSDQHLRRVGRLALWVWRLVRRERGCAQSGSWAVGVRGQENATAARWIGCRFGGIEHQAFQHGRFPAIATDRLAGVARPERDDEGSDRRARGNCAAVRSGSHTETFDLPA